MSKNPISEEILGNLEAFDDQQDRVMAFVFTA